MKTLKDLFSDNLSYGFMQYKDFLFGLIIGLFLGWAYHKYIGNRTLKTSYERLLTAKEEMLDSYKEIIGGRLAGIVVDRKSKYFFDKIKRYFKARGLIKK